MRGFTLIETVVYLALLSVLITGAIMSFYSILSSEEQVQRAVSIEGEGSFVLAKIDRALIDAVEILEPTAGQGSALRVLTDVETISVYLEQGAVLLRRDGATNPLTTENVTVTSFSVTNTSGMVDVALIIDGVTFMTRHYIQP